MNHVSQLVTSKKKLEKLVTSNKLTSLDIQERALLIAEGLTSTAEPNDMTSWYCKAYKLLGEGKYTSIAKAARKEHSKKLFGWLLREEMQKKQNA